MKELVGARTFFPAVERHATKVGFHDGDYHGTFAQYGDRVLRLCDAMKRELGIEHGDRFAVMAANSHQYLELYAAAFLGAGIANPLNLRLARKELQFILADSGTKTVFVDGFFAERLARDIDEVRRDLPLERIVLIGDGDGPNDVRFEDLVAAAHPVLPVEPDEEDPVVLMYTGGTTGLPKGVLLSQRAELLNLYHIAMAVGLDESRVYLHQTPMFHAASMGGVLGIPSIGGTSVFLPLFEPEAVMALIEQYEINWTVMVPTMIAMLLDHPTFQPERLAPLHDLVYSARLRCIRPFGQRVRSALPDLNLWQGYGMTECSSVLTFLTDADHRQGGEPLRSAGRSVLGVDLSIQDEDGRVLGTNENGEVCARGGNVMIEYWNRPEETAAAFKDAWYHTGDEGHLDADGYLFLVDRVKDMIVTGGENVYSIEVEEYGVRPAPAVAQVAVIGIPHDVWGEQVHAIVVLHPVSQLPLRRSTQHARQSIGGYKVPRSIEFRTEPLRSLGAP